MSTVEHRPPVPGSEIPRGLTVGGQALVEGVMMRGPSRVAMAARRPDGSIALRVEDLPPWTERVALVPLVRGVVGLVESIHLGMRALQWSASIADPTRRSTRERAGAFAGALVAVVAAFAFFTALPALVASWTIPIVGSVGRTVVEGALGLALLLGYIGLVRRHPLVLRTFEYHGAEHKSVAAYEAAAPFDLEQAGRATTRHERCGTTFMLDVAVLSALLHMVTNVVWPTGPMMVVARIAAIPLVAALAYEVLRATGRHRRRRWARALTRPGLWLQGLTTAEPDRQQLEVAMVALRAAVGPSPDRRPATAASR